MGRLLIFVYGVFTNAAPLAMTFYFIDLIGKVHVPRSISLVGSSGLTSFRRGQ